VGTSTQANFVITNQGSTTLSNVTATVSYPFTILTGTPFDLAGLDSTNVVVRFAPTNAASFSNVVTFATDNDGGSINPVTGVAAFPPVVAFTAGPTVGVRPLLVNFTNSSTGTITNALWDFGDGVTSNTTLTRLTHTYPTPSTNTVTLTVNGPLGTAQLTRTNYVVVNEQPAQLALGPATLNFPATVIGQTNF